MVKTKKLPLLLLLIVVSLTKTSTAQNVLDSLVPTRGLAIAAPPAYYVDSFNLFIEKELAPRHINTLILRVDFNYQFVSHPELRDSSALSKDQVKKIVSVCKKNNIRIIPQINLLGHQSWHTRTHNLLRVYPEFDENPEVKMPETYKWPNADSLYCKSYCPLHPGVHKVVFALVDEIVDAFEADAFHAGMDEVFYIGNPKCPRCGGKDKAALFAGEVTRIRDHLARSGKELWIWGDRLIDGYTT
ncbi:MAG TPA: family 20 glycosylhydrolase, partial [Chitinophagaceae bacterium]|nr:family 20 glycosylhydrolase [Chitinophagaceae bacterium]